MIVAPAARYTRTAVVLHWLIALLVVTLISIGLYMTDIPRNTPARGWYYNLHKSLGLLAACVILLRVGWRLRFNPPPDSRALPVWQTTAARISHALLYLCLLLMPLTGYVGSSFNKYGVKFFGLALPHWGWEDPALREFFSGAHQLIAGAFIGLILLHVAAALYHLYRRDGVFTRMWLHRG